QITTQAESMDLYAKIQEIDKQTREANITEVKQDIIASLDEEAEDYDAQVSDASDIFDELVKAEVRRLITDDKVRPDGREPDQIRPLNSQVGLLPRAHGSALFTRGQTQALSVATLGGLGEHQIIDGLGVKITNATCTTTIYRTSLWVKLVQSADRAPEKSSTSH